MHKITQLLHVLLFSFLLFSSQSAAAAEQEYALKAGFLYNFARYGEWHDSALSPDKFVICSPDALFTETAKSVLNQRSVDKRPITIRHIQFELEQVNQCQLLFISSASLSDWLSWQKQQDYIAENTMVVGESKGLIEAGGHIRFFIASGKIRFEVSPQQLQQSGITMSSKVLRLGRVLER
ncbi:YfiR family protein [Shewanella sp. MMG014]|uniref:YfiR family protein n=1 Tax=Shewanella sp. MMG014 TaxID=2822691 RepID=UPI001B36A2E3|nr:YfiR family protein [Shewanella sp. MMG014]MBQ4891547.1 YfiR family protein [Shewanella sp. MMG014]